MNDQKNLAGSPAACFLLLHFKVHARQAALTPGGVDLFALSLLFFDSDSTKLSCLIHSGKWSGGAAAAELQGLQRRGGGRAHCCRSASAPSVTQTLSSAQVLTLTCCHLGTIRTPCVWIGHEILHVSSVSASPTTFRCVSSCNLQAACSNESARVKNKQRIFSPLCIVMFQRISVGRVCVSEFRLGSSYCYSRASKCLSLCQLTVV